MAAKFNKLLGKHVLVLGGTSGIGYSVAEGALAYGAAVTVSSLHQHKVDAAVAALKAEFPGQKVLGVAADLASPDVEAVLEATFKAAEAAHGQVHHVALLGAPPPYQGPLADVTAELITEVSKTRLVAALVLAKVAARHLEKSPSSSLTFTTGVTVERPQRGWILTGTLGGGLEHSAKLLALDMAPVRVNVVRPGPVHTPMWDAFPEQVLKGALERFKTSTLTGGIGQPEDVAEAYLYFMKDRNVTGTVATSDGGSLLK